MEGDTLEQLPSFPVYHPIQIGEFSHLFVLEGDTLRTVVSFLIDLTLYYFRIYILPISFVFRFYLVLGNIYSPFSNT